MIYLYIYLLLNLFGAIQINNWVKDQFINWNNLIDFMRATSDKHINSLTNKQIMYSICLILFIAGFIVYITAFRDKY